MHQLLQRILADPEDTDARRVYADYLSDQGDPRGEFIAAQCRLHDSDPADEGYVPMLAHCLRLEHRHAGEWVAPLALKQSYWGSDGTTHHATFERGFVRTIAVLVENVPDAWARLRALEPLEGLEVVFEEIDLDEECASWETTRDWRVLQLSPTGWFQPEALEIVLRWPFDALRELTLDGCELSSDGLKQLSEGLSAGQLTHLSLGDCVIGEGSVEQLLAAPMSEKLVHLDLSGCGLTKRKTLDALRELQALRELWLSSNTPLGSKLGALAGWEVLAQLTTLALPLSVEPKQFAELFPAPSEALRTLILTSAKELMKEPSRVAEAVVSLASLDIGNTRFGDKLLPQLLEPGTLSTLHTLHANGCSLSDKGLAALIERGPQRLVNLDLSSNKLSDAGMRQVAEWPGLANVCWLRIGNNRKVGADGWRALIESPHFDPIMFDVGSAAANGESGDALRERFGSAIPY